MKVIHKFTVPFQEVAYVQIPQVNTILRIDGVEGQIYLWAIVDTESPLINQKLYLFKTGMEMPIDIKDYTYHGCGAIFIGMELMMYIFTKSTDVHSSVAPITKWEGFPSWGFPV